MKTTDLAQRKDKIVTLKSTVDALVRHGILNNDCKRLFQMISLQYIFVRDPLLKQIAIEGVCKMLFSKTLFEDYSQAEVESAVCYLLIQLFDKKYNQNNSLVVNILSMFFKNVVLFSKKRVEVILNALTYVVYGHVTANYKLI